MKTICVFIFCFLYVFIKHLNLSDHQTDLCLQDKVEQLTVWDIDNNKILNTAKPKELSGLVPPSTPVGTRWTVSNICFLGVHIIKNLVWDVKTTDLAKKKSTAKTYF